MSPNTVRTFQAAEYTFKKLLARIPYSGHRSKNDDPRFLLPRSDLDSKVETLLPLKPRLVERMGSKAGYIDLPDLFRLGFLTALINCLTWAVVGCFWWKILGLY